MSRLQTALLGLGLVMASYGGWLLLSRPQDLLPVGTWLVGGVLLHDAVLAPLVIVVCLLGVRFLPTPLRSPASMSLIIFGSLSLIALPVLGRFGAKPDNPTLLDRNYVLGWLLLGALTLAGSAFFALISPTRAIPSGEASEDGLEEV